MIFVICLKAWPPGNNWLYEKLCLLSHFFPLVKRNKLENMKIWPPERLGQQKPNKNNSQAPPLFHKRIYFLKQLLAWGLRITLSRYLYDYTSKHFWGIMLHLSLFCPFPWKRCRYPANNSGASRTEQQCSSARQNCNFRSVLFTKFIR